MGWQISSVNHSDAITSSSSLQGLDWDDDRENNLYNPINKIIIQCKG